MCCLNCIGKPNIKRACPQSKSSGQIIALSRHNVWWRVAVFSFHISCSFGEVRIIQSHCFEALATGGSNLFFSFFLRGGGSIVDSVFEEVPLVFNTDELSVVTLASLDATLPVCRLSAREPHLSQDKHTAVTI